MKVVYSGGYRMTREQVSLSILHEAPYGLALGLGLSHFVGHLQFLLLFLPVWDQKVKAELVMANGWYIVYVGVEGH